MLGRKKKKIGIGEKDFAFYYSLGDYISHKQKRKEASHRIARLFSQYRNWLDNPESSRTLRRKLVASLLPHVCKSNDIQFIIMKQIIPLEKEIETNSKIL